MLIAVTVAPAHRTTDEVARGTSEQSCEEPSEPEPPASTGYAPGLAANATSPRYRIHDRVAKVRISDGQQR
jgi:hypothetical protein